jgi:hypothetical protein
MKYDLDIEIFTSVENIRISIDNDWNVERFSKILNSFNITYCITVLATIEDNEFTRITGFNNKRELALAFLKNYEIFNGETYRRENEKFLQYFKGINSRSALSQNLLIESIRYSSPGKIDLLGLGKVMEELSKIFQYYFPNKKDKVLYEQERQRLFDMRIESLKKLGLSPDEIKKILLLDSNASKLIDKVIKEDLITNIELIEKE